jgi:hypothetical protein
VSWKLLIIGQRNVIIGQRNVDDTVIMYCDTRSWLQLGELLALACPTPNCVALDLCSVGLGKGGGWGMTRFEEGRLHNKNEFVCEGAPGCEPESRAAIRIPQPRAYAPKCRTGKFCNIIENKLLIRPNRTSTFDATASCPLKCIKT